MSRVVRHNLSGGKLGEQLWTRSDLEQYHKGNHQQSNFISTPYGGIERRPPASLLGSLPFKEIDGQWYRPDTIRGFSFVYSIDTKYSVLLVGYTADGFDDEIRFEIFSDDGTHKATVLAPYAIADFNSIDDKQVNDVIMFTHIEHEPARLVRYGDEDWRYELLEFNGGPFLSQNTNSNDKLTIGMSTWKNDFNYIAGDTVLPESSDYGTVRWIGTAFSLKYQTDIVSDIAGASLWETKDETVDNDKGYYIDIGDFCSKSLQHYAYNTYQWFPYSYIQIDKGHTLSVSDDFSINIAFDESNGDQTYAKTGVIDEIISGTTYDYIKADLGWIGFYEAANLAFNGWEGNCPWPSMPTEAEPNWLRTANLNDGTYESVFGANIVCGGTTDYSGAVIVPISGNITKGTTSATAYKAIVENTNKVVTNTDYWTSVSLPDESSIVTIESSTKELFTDSDNGRILYCDNGESYSDSGTFTTEGTTTPVFSIGDITLKTEGTIWSGEIQLEKSTDGISWDVIGRIISVNDSHNGEITRTIQGIGIKTRVKMLTITAGGECSWSVNYPQGYSSIYTISKTIDPYRAICRNITGATNFFISSLWGFGAFGGIMGYPSSVTIHEERLLLGGTKGRPFEIYGSEVNNWTNFSLGTLETSPIIFRLNSDNVTRICWLLSSQNRLFIGTDFGEYSASTPDAATVLSGVNPPRITLHTTYGSDEQKALSVHNEIVHVTADRKTMRSIAEGEYKETYGSKDLTVFAPDVGSTGISSIKLQRNPYPIIWANTLDDKLVQFTYDVENGIMGWSETELTDSLVKSHWIMPDDDGVDEVYMSVEREDIMLNLYENNGSILNDGKLFAETEGSALIVYGSADERYTGEYPYNGIVNGKRSYKKTIDDDNWTYISYSNSEPEWVLSERFQGVYYSRVAYSTTTNDIPRTWSDLSISSYGRPAYEEFVYDHGIGSPPEPSSGIDIIDGGFAFVTYPYFDIRYVFLTTSTSPIGTYTGDPPTTGDFSLGFINNHIIKIGAQTEVRGGCVDLFGEAYESIVEFTSLIQGQGILEADNVRVTQAHVYLVNSYGGEISVDGGETWEAIQYEDAELYTGMKSIRVDSGVTDDLRVLVRANGQDPFQLTGISVDVDLQENTRT